MKKACMVLVLAALLVLPVLASEEQTGKRKFTVSVGGLLASVSQGQDFNYSFDSWGETARWTESVGNVGSAFGLDIGVGVYPIPQFEIYVSYNSYGGDGMGGYTLNIPHWYYDDESVSHTIANVENEFKASVFSFGLAFHPTVKGKIKPYFGAGLSSVSMEVDLLDSVSLNDIRDIDVWYDYVSPYYWFELGETIEITKVGFTQESETMLGFHLKAGVDIEVGRDISIFAEAHYLSATIEFDRPDITFKAKITEDYYEYWYGSEYEYIYTWTDEEEFDIDDTVEIKLGGVQVVVGIRITF